MALHNAGVKRKGSIPLADLDYRSALVWPAVLWSDQTNRRFRQRRSRRMRSSGGHGLMPEETGPLRDLHPPILRRGARAGGESSIRCRRSARPASQGHEGWVCLSQGYNDDGFSGATMDRSGLRQLLADIAQAQREACEAFIASQRHEGWILPRAGYGDGSPARPPIGPLCNGCSPTSRRVVAHPR